MNIWDNLEPWLSVAITHRRRARRGGGGPPSLEEKEKSKRREAHGKRVAQLMPSNRPTEAIGLPTPPSPSS